jgi:membrane protein
MPEVVPDVVRSFVRRILEMEGVDRAIVLAAQAFTALFPLLIVYGSLVSDSGGAETARRLSDRFNLDESSTETVNSLFDAGHGDVQFRVLGALLVFLSALSFTRAAQRLYERAWGLPRVGLAGTGWGVAWLAALLCWLSVQPLLGGELDGPLSVVASLASGCLVWLATPYLLLGRRIGWGSLVPGAVLTAVAMTVVGLGSAIAMPRVLSQGAEEFGTIGVAFALVSWLTVLAFTLMATAAAGAVVAEEIRDRRAARVA